MKKLQDKKAIDDEIKAQLVAVIKEAKDKFNAGKGQAA